MQTQSSVFEKKDTQLITHLLNKYLASYQVHYQKIRGCHWNVTGSNFFPLHAKFEELYTNAFETIDAIAERILTLGDTPLNTYSDYLGNSEIQETETRHLNERQMVEALLSDFTTLISQERKILELTASCADDGTNDMVNGFMQFKEKNSWMLQAFLK